jgi:insulysin
MVVKRILFVEIVEHYKDVISLVFSYIDILKSHPPEEWSFQEVSILSTIAFQFKEKSRPSSYVLNLTSRMQQPFIPEELLLKSSYVMDSWDRELVSSMLSHLREDNCRIMISCRDGVEGVEWDTKEEWYGTDYTIRKSDKVNKVSIWKNYYCHGTLNDTIQQNIDRTGISLPPPNEFVPKNLEIKNKKEVIEVCEARQPGINNLIFLSTISTKNDRFASVKTLYFGCGIRKTIVGGFLELPS